MQRGRHSNTLLETEADYSKTASKGRGVGEALQELSGNLKFADDLNLCITEILDTR
jgi:hypothetical protein